MNRTLSLGVNVWMIVTKIMTPMAMPRSFQAETVWPAATRILEENTIHPEAVKPRIMAWVETTVARSFGRR